MSLKNIMIENVSPGIRVVRISRPKALNALNMETLDELKAVAEDAAGDPGVRIVVLTGDGDKAFVAGADISEMKDMDEARAQAFAWKGHEAMCALEEMPKPVIAAVNGYALGGGCELACACDFIIASDRAVFGQPEAGLGIIPGFGGQVRLARFIGYPKARELIYSGRRLKADEALAMGLANSVFPAAELMSRVLELARQISQQSRGAVAAAKKLMNGFCEPGGTKVKLETEARIFSRLFSGRDQKEGMAAFAEKRRPAFDGLDA